MQLVAVAAKKNKTAKDGYQMHHASASNNGNGFRYYRALESVSMIASALSTALTIYPCQIRVHQR